MADFVFNIAKGRVNEMISNGDALRMLVLKATGTEAQLQDYNTVADLLADVNVTEADFTNYVAAPTGKSLTESYTTNDTDDRGEGDFTDVTYTSAGGATNNTCVAVVVYKFVTNNADSIPLTHHDASFTTNGSDVTISTGSGGFFQAS